MYFWCRLKPTTFETEEIFTHIYRFNANIRFLYNEGIAKQLFCFVGCVYILCTKLIYKHVAIWFIFISFVTRKCWWLPLSLLLFWYYLRCVGASFQFYCLSFVCAFLYFPAFYYRGFCLYHLSIIAIKDVYGFMLLFEYIPF